MNNNIIARAALATSLALTAALPLRAQAPAPTTFTFSQANGATITGNKLVIISVNIVDSVGLKYATLSGAGRGSTMVCSGVPSASLSMFWNTTNSPAGDYKFTSGGYNSAGNYTTGSVTVHLTK